MSKNSNSFKSASIDVLINLTAPTEANRTKLRAVGNDVRRFAACYPYDEHSDENSTRPVTLDITSVTPDQLSTVHALIQIHAIDLSDVSFNVKM